MIACVSDSCESSVLLVLHRFGLQAVVWFRNCSSASWIQAGCLRLLCSSSFEIAPWTSGMLVFKSRVGRVGSDVKKANRCLRILSVGQLDVRWHLRLLKLVVVSVQLYCGPIRLFLDVHSPLPTWFGRTSYCTRNSSLLGFPHVQPMVAIGTPESIKNPNSFISGPAIRRVDPLMLPTLGGHLTLHGDNLGLEWQLTLRASNLVSCELIEQHRNRVVVRIGPGFGERIRVTLQNAVGTSSTEFSYQGE